jgi:hypothetical protein
MEETIQEEVKTIQLKQKLLGSSICLHPRLEEREE